MRREMRMWVGRRETADRGRDKEGVKGLSTCSVIGTSCHSLENDVVADQLYRKQ